MRFFTFLFWCCVALLAVGCAMALLHIGEPSAHTKEVWCYAGNYPPPKGGDCINYVQPNWQP